MGHNVRQALRSSAAVVHGRSQATLIAAAAAVAAMVAPSVASAASGTWQDPASPTQPTLTTTASTSITSSIPMKDGDIVRFPATGFGGFNANTIFYVVGTGNTPSTTIKLSGNPGGAAQTASAGSGTVTKTQEWVNPSNWVSSVIPNGFGDSASIATDTNTTQISLNKDITIGSMNFSATSNDLSLISGINGTSGTLSKLIFAGGSTPTINVSGGKSLFFSDSNPTPGNNNGKLVMAGTQGLTIDNANPFGTLPVAPGVATPGAVKFGFIIDWQRMSGDLTLARGAFALNGGGSNQALSALPINNRVILGTGANQAQLELFANVANTYIRGLDGNANSAVINNATSGGPALTIGSYGVASDSFNFQGSLGVPISTPSAGSTPASLRIVKIGAGTQTLSGQNPIASTNVVTINDGTLSLGATGTIGTLSGPGQAAGVLTQNFTMHNGEFKMLGTSANARSESFGPLLLTNGTSTGSSFSGASNGWSRVTLTADAAQPISLTFASLPLRNLGAASTNANANGQTTLYRGTSLGSTPGNGVATIKFTTNPLSAAQQALLGGTGAPVLKGALADTNASGSGAGFATYDGTTGVRLLSVAEQDTTNPYPGSSVATNVRLNLTGPASFNGVTTQTLQLDNTSGSPQTVTSNGTGLNASAGLLISGSSAVTLTGGTLTGTAATDNEDVVIHNTNTAGATIGIAVSNPGAASKPGWIVYNGPGNTTITGAQTVGNSGGIAFNSTGTTLLQGSLTNVSQLAVNQGTVKLDTGSTFNTKPQLLVAAGATFDLNGQSGATILFDAINTNVVFNGAGVNAAAGTVTNTGANVNLTLNAGTAGVFPGVITGNLNLDVAKSGSSLLQTLTGANTYSGTTTIRNGSTLAIGRYGSIPATSTLTLGDATTAGTLQLGTNSSASDGGVAAVEQTVPNLTATLATSAVVGGAINFSTLNVNYTNTATPDTYIGNLGGATGQQNNLLLKKSGAGTLVLSGTNTYTGSTTVVGGTLNVTTSLANNDSYKVFVAVDPDGTFGTSDDISIVRKTTGSYKGMGSSEVGGLNSTADLLQGANTSGSDTTLAMQWRQRALTETNDTHPPLLFGSTKLASDVISLTGMVNSGALSGQTDPYALQMTYDETQIVGDEQGHAALGELFLETLDTSSTPQWVNAVALDTGTGGSAVTNFQGTYTAFAAANSITDANLSNFLGSWGSDPTTNTAWAIVNHNSQFAVAAVPEPASAAGILLGAAGLLSRRRRRPSRRAS